MDTAQLALPDDVLLRASEVERWQDERKQLVAQRQAIDEKLEALDRRLAAVAVLTDGRLNGHPAPVAGLNGGSHHTTSHDDDDVENMAQAAKRIVASSSRPPRNKDIVRELRKNPLFGERLERNPNYYYTMIGRLVRRHELVKSGDVYSMPQQN